MSIDDIKVLLGLVGAAVAWAVMLWLKRSDRREDAMKALLEKQKIDAEAERDKARRDADRGWSLARAYWRQLVKAGIDPVPPMEGDRHDA